MNALFVLCGVGIVSLIAEITNLRKGLSLLIIIGFAGAAFLLIRNWNTDLHYYNSMLVFDNFSIAYSSLISIVSIFWFGFSNAFFEESSSKTDRSALLIFAVIGAVLMVSFNNLAMLFLGIEILSISLYVLAGSKRRSLNSTEASFKYFLMGSFATGFLLFGIALIYGATGSFDITHISQVVSSQPTGLPAFFYIGVLLMLVGMSFKISAAPFHFWAPDVYEGAPTSITSFMATVVKIATVGAFFKMFAICFSSVSSTYSLVLQGMMILTLIIANVTAVQQTNVKRMLAYSSVGHVGYILLALIASPDSPSTIFYYLTAYCVATVAAFAIVSVVENAKGSVSLEAFNGFFIDNPFLSVILTIALFSLAGIPPLAGFFAKYIVFASAIEHGLIGFVLIAVAASLISIYYYFKVVRVMFSSASDSAPIALPLGIKLLFILLLILNIALGLFPNAFIDLLN
jgi:NADH-quinone oxidoreductase subunit N